MEKFEIFLGLVVAFCVGALFSAVEMAYISLDKARLKTLRNRRDGIGKRVRWITDRPRQFIIFILLGNNFAMIYASALATLFAGTLLPRWENHWVEILVITVMTPLIVIFAELIPKSFGLHHAVGVCRKANSLVYWGMILLLPLVGMLFWLTNLLLFPFRSLSHKNVSRMTRQDLHRIFEEGYQKGALSQPKKRLIDEVFDFHYIPVKQKMVPYLQVPKVEVNESLAKLKEVAAHSPFVRLLVYDQNPMNVLGFVNIYDVLFDDNPDVSIRDHIRMPVIVPETMLLDEAMEILCRKKEWFLVVVGKGDKPVGTLPLKRLLNF